MTDKKQAHEMHLEQIFNSIAEAKERQMNLED
jgi:hypothetical protein